MTCPQSESCWGKWLAKQDDDQQDVGSACERQGWQASRKGVLTTTTTTTNNNKKIASQLSTLNSQFSTLNPQLSALNSQFPTLSSPLSALRSQFPYILCPKKDWLSKE